MRHVTAELKSKGSFILILQSKEQKLSVFDGTINKAMAWVELSKVAI